MSIIQMHTCVENGTEMSPKTLYFCENETEMNNALKDGGQRLAP